MSFRLNPFDSFVALENERVSLYQDLTTNNSEDNIARVWFNYANNVLLCLVGISDLAKIIYKRYYDEYSKDKGKIQDNANLEPEILKKIQNVLNISTESSLLLKAYYDFLIYGIFGECADSPDQRFLIEIENQIDFIISLFFKSETPESCLSLISSNMNVIREIHQKQRLLSIIDQARIEDPQYNEILGEVSEAHGRYYYSHIAPLIKKIGDEWWWEDLMLQFFSYDQAFKHYNKAIKDWKDSKLQDTISTVDRIKLVGTPNAKAETNYTLARYQFNIGIMNAIGGLHKHASKYFDIASTLSNTALTEIGKYPSGDYLRNLQKRIHAFKERTELLSGISKINILFRSMVKNINSGDFDQASNDSSEIKDLIPTLTGTMDFKYLSALPSLLESVASTYELMISLEKPKDEILEQINDIINSFKNRITIATNQLVNYWNDINNEDEHEVLVSKLKIDQIDIQSLIESNSMLPTTVFERDLIFKRLECLAYLTDSVLEDIKASKLTENHKVQELIHKAKAHFYAKKALELSKDIPHDLMPLNRIKANFSGTLISGKSVQMHLHQLACQYLCLSETLPSLFLAISQDPSIVRDKQDSILVMRKSLQPNEILLDLLSQVELDCDSLIHHKENFDRIIARVQWNQIIVRKSLVLGIRTFYESIVEALIASWSSKLELFDDALVYFKTAQDKAFEASEILKVVKQSGSNTDSVATHVFSFAQFCQNSYNDVKENKTVSLPAQQLFKLFRDMVFSI
ncbi:MAG: hypothetical protein ACXAD7_17680 [Candidatus Kariarchaeaceae archaeon]|jgi:hypothetical protein